MRRCMFLILALATLLPTLAQAYDILVLQSRRDPAYEEALKGFRTTNSNSQRTIVLSDYAEVDVVRIVREDHPRMILAVGDTALTATRPVQQTPVIALMALGIHKLKASHSNLTGVGMFAPPERYITLFQTMGTHRVGVIYNPARSGWYVQYARHMAEKTGIELVTREVSAARDTLGQLSSLAGKVDALWMLPDVTAVARETVEAYFRFGQEQRIPVISFAGSYLGLGAAAVVEINPTELGRQGGTMAAAILDGSNPSAMAVRYAHGTGYKINNSVLKKFGSLFGKMKKIPTK